jgi:hypothetical protein
VSSISVGPSAAAFSEPSNESVSDDAPIAFGKKKREKAREGERRRDETRGEMRRERDEERRESDNETIA